MFLPIWFDGTLVSGGGRGEVPATGVVTMVEDGHGQVPFFFGIFTA